MSRWAFEGFQPPREGWCSQPMLFVDRAAGAAALPGGEPAWFIKRCKSSRPSKCVYCAGIKRGDVAAVGRSGWVDRPSDRGYWCTLTAPGVAVLPWDRSRCQHSPGAVRCSGEHGCVVEADALAIWHADIALRWSHFVTDLRRLLNPGRTGSPATWPVQVEFFKTYETQLREALHLHEMLRVLGVVSDAEFRRVYKLAAARNGFGKQSVCDQVDLSDRRVSARCAGYCASYAAKNADALPLLRRLDRETGELTVGGLRSWSASRRWGESMKQVEARRCVWSQGAGSLGASRAPALTAGGAGLDLYQEIYASSQGLTAPAVELSVIAG